MAANDFHFDTRAVHAGRDTGPVQDPREPRPEGMGSPVAPGIQPSTSYHFDEVASLYRAFDHPSAGYVYARHGGPTNAGFAGAVAALEETDGAVAYASGMAAIHAALLACEVGPGDTIVAGRDLYGATQTLLTSVFGAQGVRTTLVDATNLHQVGEAVTRLRPKLLYVETISNPLLRVVDLPALAQIARDAGARLLVDNTFASPYLCRPVAFGAAAAIHSATKYLSGHGDVTAGVVAAGATLLPPLQLAARLLGATLGAFDAWLAMRGLRTLSLRVARQCDSARRIALELRQHRKIGAVHYPGLASHPQHDLADRLFAGRGFGGVLSIELKDGGNAGAARFMDALRLILPAPTMGDIYSLALYPAGTSHRGLTPEQRAALGIGDNLVRLSIGIEDVADLLADLDQSLAAV